MTYPVRVSQLAATEIAATYRYIAFRSRVGANRWRAGIRAAIRSLRDNPQRCAISPESELAGEELRERYYGRRVGTYRILFGIEDDSVYVLRVRHGRQDLLVPEDFAEDTP